MRQEDYNHAFSHGLIFGACLAFAVTMAAVWSLQPSPPEERQRCLQIIDGR